MGMIDNAGLRIFLGILTNEPIWRSQIEVRQKYPLKRKYTCFATFKTIKEIQTALSDAIKKLITKEAMKQLTGFSYYQNIV